MRCAESQQFVVETFTVLNSYTCWVRAKRQCFIGLGGHHAITSVGTT